MPLAFGARDGDGVAVLDFDERRAGEGVEAVEDGVAGGGGFLFCARLAALAWSLIARFRAMTARSAWDCSAEDD